MTAMNSEARCENDVGKRWRQVCNTFFQLLEVLVTASHNKEHFALCRWHMRFNYLTVRGSRLRGTKVSIAWLDRTRSY
jgi:hypothetical protein